MKGRTKRSKYVAVRTRRIVAEQVRARMRARYPQHSFPIAALAEEAGTSISTIQRILDVDNGVGVTVDILTLVAMALRCEPFELLLPHDRQDRAASPQETPAGSASQ